MRLMNNLAITYGNQGRWKEAEDLQVEVLETWKKVLGDAHPDTLSSMNNLAITYYSQGRWKEAEDLQVEVLETWKKVLGDAHPDTLTSMSNLAIFREKAMEDSHQHEYKTEAVKGGWFHGFLRSS